MHSTFRIEKKMISQWLMIIIPIKWLFHWEYTLFSDKPISHFRFRVNFCGNLRYMIKLGVPKLMAILYVDWLRVYVEWLWKTKKIKSVAFWNWHSSLLVVFRSKRKPPQTILGVWKGRSGSVDRACQYLEIAMRKWWFAIRIGVVYFQTNPSTPVGWNKISKHGSLSYLPFI